MKVEHEAQIWQYAAARYDESLISIVAGALGSFRRAPGLDALTRIHKADIGALAFTVLHQALPQANSPWSDGSFVHIARHRPWALILSASTVRRAAPARA